MRKIVAVFLVILLSGLAAGWGPEAQKLICESAAQDIFGASSQECFTDLSGVCSLAGLKGDGYRIFCESKAPIHPALLSSEVFSDTQNHFNYSACPLSSRSMQDWACVAGGTDYAGSAALYWIDEAEGSDDLCMRVYTFCVASSYLADAKTPIYQVMHVEDESRAAFEEKIDSRLGEESWSVSYLVVFQENQKRKTERMTSSDSELESIISGLASDYSYLKLEEALPDPCENGVKDPGEEGIDCGGACSPCPTTSTTLDPCRNGAKDAGEEDVDCGGACSPCVSSESSLGPLALGAFFVVGIFFVFAFLAAAAFLLVRSRKKKKDAIGEELYQIKDDLESVGAELDDI